MGKYKCNYCFAELETEDLVYMSNWEVVGCESKKSCPCCFSSDIEDYCEEI